MPRTLTSTEEINSQIDEYLQAFNEMRLDEVLEYFAPDCVYEPGDGSRLQGRAQIRRSLAPHFSHAWGSIFFKETDRIVDSSLREVVLVWDCHIDPSTARYYTWSTWLRTNLGKLRYRKGVVWKGLDVLHLDEQGLITKKLTYANYKSILLRSAKG